MNNYCFSIVNLTDKDWTLIEKSYESTCFQSKQWIAYLIRIGLKPIFINVIYDVETIGFFIGEHLKFGLFSIITAPFNGIGTYTQGLVMLKETNESLRIEIYKSMAKWLFDNHIASLLQVDDWSLRQVHIKFVPYNEFNHDVLDKYGVKFSVRATLCVPVNTNEQTMWAGLHYKSAKYSINKAKKHGLFVREITKYEDIEKFTKYHYSQLIEVCAKQGMRPKPSQKQKRMQILCEELFPNRVIMLECVGKDDNGIEQIMSSGIFCIDKGECIYWTGASFQRYQKFCPNELMVWEAMKILNQRGGGILNFGGMASYKLKFGTEYYYIPRLSFVKHKFIYSVKLHAQEYYFGTRNFIAKVVGKKKFK